MKRTASVLLSLILFLSLTIGLSSCANKPTGNMVVGMLTSATATYTYNNQEVERRYFYYIPSIYKPGKKLPLMLTLHGSGSSATMQLDEGDWVNVAEKNGFIVIAPESIAIHADGTLSSQGKSIYEIGQTDAAFVRWYAAYSDPIAKYGVDDTAYLCDLIDLFVDQGYVDADRVFSSGLSHGAFMSVRLAIEAPEKIAGIGVVAGLLTTEMEAKLTDKRVKLVFINSTDDPIVPNTGMYYDLDSDGEADDVWSYSVEDSIDIMLEHYGIAVKAVNQTELPDADTSDQVTISRYEYVDTKGNVPAVAYVLNGGGHVWPGGTQYLPYLWIGRLAKDAQGSELLWAELKNVKNPNN